MKKRCQITLFIILGIVIFIIIALLFYITSYTAKKETKEKIAKSEEVPLALQPLKEYVIACLDKTTKDALFLLGKQGGYIYESQGGTVADYLGAIRPLPSREGSLYVNYNGYIVSYGIYPPRFDIGFYAAKPPEYPWIKFPYGTALLTAKNYQGYFGLNSLPRLLKTEGPHSIQLQLETYINNNMQNCTDFSVFKEFKVTGGAIKTDVAIAENDVAINLYRPLDVKVLAGGETKKISEFGVNQKIRLKTIYNFAREAMINDISVIDFDISTNDEGSLAIDVLPDVNDKGDDMIVAKDELSLLKGRPYEFQFARHNRYPALFYIKQPASTFEQGDIIYKSNITEKPEALDPDEDIIDMGSSFKFFHPINNQELPYEISPVDVQRKCRPDDPQNLTIRVSVTDGNLIDYQDVAIPLKCPQ